MAVRLIAQVVLAFAHACIAGTAGRDATVALVTDVLLWPRPSGQCTTCRSGAAALIHARVCSCVGVQVGLCVCVLPQHSNVRLCLWAALSSALRRTLLPAPPCLLPSSHHASSACQQLCIPVLARVVPAVNDAEDLGRQARERGCCTGHPGQAGGGKQRGAGVCNHKRIGAWRAFSFRHEGERNYCRPTA